MYYIGDKERSLATEIRTLQLQLRKCLEKASPYDNPEIDEAFDGALDIIDESWEAMGMVKRAIEEIIANPDYV